jgi:hypothetical protein
MENDLRGKTRLLNALQTGELLNQLNQLIDEAADFQVKKQRLIDENSDFLGSTSRDCEAARIVELNLILNSPEFETEGKS